MTALLLLRSAAGPALGVFTQDSDSAEPAAFISAAGETPSCVLRFSNYTLAFDATHTNTIHAAGQIPVISWMYGDGTQTLPQATYTLSNLLAGNFDTYMTTYLNAIKALGYDVYVTWSAEMNGNWQLYSEGVNGNTTGQYALAWKYVHDLAASLGVTNIKWVWQPTSIYETSTPLAGLYPGDAYVDVVAMAGYSWGATMPGGWVDPPALYNPTLAEIATLTTSKPIWIGEMGCAPDDGGSKTAWYAAFFAWLPTSLVNVFIYFENPGTPNWKVDSGTGTAAAFTAGMAYLRSGAWAIPNVTSLSLPGNVNTNSISTPATGVVPTSGGIDVRFKGLMTASVGTTRVYISTEAPEWAFTLCLPWDNTICLKYHSNGWANYRSTVPYSLTTGTVGSFRAVMIPNGTGSDCLFYQSTDWDPIADTGTWTQVGTTVNGTESSTLVATTGNITVGGTATASENPVTNVVYASVRPYGGAEVASFNPTAVHSTAAELPTTYTDAQSNPWTIAGTTWAWVTTDAEGTGTGTTTRTGTATGTRTPKGSSVGTTTFTSSATGKRTPKGSASGTSTFTGAASGKRTPKGSASGSSTFTGSASGQRISLGSGTGTSTFTGVASGARVSAGSGTGSVTFTGTATGTRTPKGSGTGTATWTGAAVGQRAPKGAGSGTTKWTGTAIGSAPAIGGASGSASGDTLWTGVATGARASAGSAAGSTVWTGTATGTAHTSGFATGSTLWTGTALGATVQSGSCAGLTTWTGTATGEMSAPYVPLVPETRILAVPAPARALAVPAGGRARAVSARPHVRSVP